MLLTQEKEISKRVEDKQDEETIIRPKEYMPYEGGRQVNMPLAYEKIMLMLI